MASVCGGDGRTIYGSLVVRDLVYKAPLNEDQWSQDNCSVFMKSAVG